MDEEEIKQANKEEINQAKKDSLILDMENKLGFDSVDKEKIAFLKGYRQGIVEAYLPKEGDNIEEMVRKRKSTMQQRVVDELIEEVKKSQY